MWGMGFEPMSLSAEDLKASSLTTHSPPPIFKYKSLNIIYIFSIYKMSHKSHYYKVVAHRNHHNHHSTDIKDSAHIPKIITIQLLSGEINKFVTEHDNETISDLKDAISLEMPTPFGEPVLFNRDNDNILSDDLLLKDVYNVFLIIRDKFDEDDIQHVLSLYDNDKGRLDIDIVNYNKKHMDIIFSLLKTNGEIYRPINELFLVNISIGDSTAIELASCLKVNTTLSKLILFSNKIGPTGANALASSLKVNKTLKLLNIKDNRIGEFGKNALLDALTENNVPDRKVLLDE